MSIPLHNEIHYPESDGRPMETQIHAQVLEDLRFALVRRYADVPDVYVWGNLFLYYREGDPSGCVGPDVFLIRGVPKRQDNPRRIYKVWDEGGRVPSLVIEGGRGPAGGRGTGPAGSRGPPNRRRAGPLPGRRAEAPP